MRNTHRSLATSLALLTTLAIAGCSGAFPGGVTPTPTDEGSAAASATPQPAAPSIDPNILFTISVTATAPNGAIADLTQTVYTPVAATTQQAADEAALDGECGGWRTEYPAAEYLVSLIEVTDESPAGVRWDRSVAVVSMNGWPTYTGAVDTFQAYCASYQVNLGSSRAVSPVTAGSGADGQHGWAHVSYGFGIATEAGSVVPGPDDTLLSNCQITLSPAAAASTIASTWAAYTDPLSCAFGEYDYGV